MGHEVTPNSPSVAPHTPSGGISDSSGQPSQQPATPSTPQQPPQAKEINTAMVCRIGQETVQEIVSRTHEVFSYLRQLQPPYGSTMAGNVPKNLQNISFSSALS